MNFLRRLIYFLVPIYTERRVLKALVIHDLQVKYLGSYMGILWAFIQPAVTMALLWFVFELGFKSKRVNENVPFVLWLMTGMIPWFFVSEVIVTGTGVIREHSYLVQKIVFKTNILPLVKIFSALAIHVCFIFALFFIFILNGSGFSIYYLQIFYYTFAAIVLLMGLTWISSSISVFFRDLGQIINLMVQFAFWGTPIFWSISILPDKYANILKWNPIFYITEGYRNCLIEQRGFWEEPYMALSFWGFTGFTFFMGAVLFQKLRKYFADVL